MTSLLEDAKDEQVRTPACTLARLTLAHPGHVAIAAALGLLVGGLGWGAAFLIGFVIDHTSDISHMAWIALVVALARILRHGFAVL
jgi:hypothetical protein